MLIEQGQKFGIYAHPTYLLVLHVFIMYIIKLPWVKKAAKCRFHWLAIRLNGLTLEATVLLKSIFASVLLCSAFHVSAACEPKSFDLPRLSQEMHGLTSSNLQLIEMIRSLSFEERHVANEITLPHLALTRL